MLAQYQMYLAGAGFTVQTVSGAQALYTTTECCMVQLYAISTNTGVTVITISTGAASTGGLPIWPGSTQPMVTVYATDLANVFFEGISTEGVYYAYYKQKVGVTY